MMSAKSTKAQKSDFLHPHGVFNNSSAPIRSIYIVCLTCCAKVQGVQDGMDEGP